MNKFNRYAVTMASIALVLVAVLAVSMVGTRMATAAPVAQEIPAATSNARNTPAGATLFYGVVTTATGAVTYGDAVDVTPYDGSELNLVVNQTIVAAAANTVSLAYQSSANRLDWTTIGVITNNVADANTWIAPQIVGRYLRIRVTPSNALPVTVTLAGVLKPTSPADINITGVTTE